MIPLTRLYASEADAKKAVTNLKKAGFPDTQIALLKPEDQATPETQVDEAVRAERLPRVYKKIATESLEQGRCVVTIYTLFGEGQAAQLTMDAAGPVDTDRLPEWPTADTRLVSAMYGVPLLAKRRFNTVSDSSALLSKKRFTVPSLLGMGLLSSKAAPLSDALNIPALRERPKTWTKSMGFPLLKNNPAPLSSALGIKPLLERHKNWQNSMGFPILSRDPHPLSTMLGLPVLTKRKR
jgi:hypothetical protein